jgi:hypothetical protein
MQPHGPAVAPVGLRSVNHSPSSCRRFDGPCDPGSPAPAPARRRVRGRRTKRGRGLLTACVPGPVERSVGAVAARAHHRCTVRDAILDPTGLRGSADGVRSGAEERHAGAVAGRAPTVVASCPPRSSIRQGRRRDEPRAHRGGESAWRTSLRGAPTVVASCPPQAMWALVLLAALVYPTGARGLLTAFAAGRKSVARASWRAHADRR